MPAMVPSSDVPAAAAETVAGTACPLHPYLQTPEAHGCAHISLLHGTDVCLQPWWQALVNLRSGARSKLGACALATPASADPEITAVLCRVRMSSVCRTRASRANEVHMVYSTAMM